MCLPSKRVAISPLCHCVFFHFLRCLIWVALVSLLWLVANLLLPPLSPLLPDFVVFVKLCCASLCVDPALMRKSTSADSNVGKSGRLDCVVCLHSPALLSCQQEAHFSHCPSVLRRTQFSVSPVSELVHLYRTAWGQRTESWVWRQKQICCDQNVYTYKLTVSALIDYFTLSMECAAWWWKIGCQPHICVYICAYASYVAVLHFVPLL